MLSARHCAARGTGTTEQAGVQGAGGSLRPAPRKSRGAGCYQSRTRGATVMGRRRPCSRVSALTVEKSSAQEVGPLDFAWLNHGTGFLSVRIIDTALGSPLAPHPAGNSIKYRNGCVGLMEVGRRLTDCWVQILNLKS